MCSIQPCGHRRAHHRHAHLRHHSAHIGKIHIDQTRTLNNFRDAGNRTMQYSVCCLERIKHADVFAKNLHQLVVRNHNERIDVAAQFFQPLLRNFLALSFESERLGDHGDRQNAQFACGLGNDRCGARTGTATHARREE